MMKYNKEYKLFVTLCVCKSKLIYHIYIYMQDHAGLCACYDAIVETKIEPRLHEYIDVHVRPARLIQPMVNWYLLLMVCSSTW